MNEDLVESELDLGDYLQILRGRWFWVVGSFLLVGGLAALVTLTASDAYTSTAKVAVGGSEVIDTFDNTYVNAATLTREISNEINFAKSDEIVGAVKSELGLDPLKKVDISGDSAADILNFRATAATPDESAFYANTWADAYVAGRRQQAQNNLDTGIDVFQERLNELQAERDVLQQPLADLEQRIDSASSEDQTAALQRDFDKEARRLEPKLNLLDARIASTAQGITDLELQRQLKGLGTAQILQVAFPPIDKSNAPLSRNLPLGLAVGAMMGIAAAFLADNLDRSLKTIDDVRKAVDVPVLGSVPEAGKYVSEEELALSALNQPEGPIADGYHQIRTALQFSFLSRDVQSLLVTSANQSEAKTTTSANLASSMAAVGTKVVLADVDFRRPRIHEVFGCDAVPGLSNHLVDGLPLHELVLHVDEADGNLVIMPSGSPPPSPGDFVASPAFVDVIRLMEKEADLVVFDAPPILPVADALSMARNVDAVLVVAFAGRTNSVQLRRAVENLRQVGADIAGVVLVGVKHDPVYGRYGYRYEVGTEKKKSLLSRITRGS